jgi:hypothetical protein
MKPQRTNIFLPIVIHTFLLGRRVHGFLEGLAVTGLLMLIDGLLLDGRVVQGRLEGLFEVATKDGALTVGLLVVTFDEGLLVVIFAEGLLVVIFAEGLLVVIFAEGLLVVTLAVGLLVVTFAVGLLEASFVVGFPVGTSFIEHTPGEVTVRVP